MDNTNNITISKYINGELTGAELAEFEKLLQQDKAFNDEVNFHKIVDETLAENYQATSKINDSERLEFEGILSKVMQRDLVTELEEDDLNEQSTPNDTVTSNTLIRRLIPFAALAAAAAILFFMMSPPNLSNLADQNYTHYNYDADHTLGPGDLEEGINAYDNKNYKKALPIFNENLTGDLKLHLAKGNAEYNLGKYEEAIETFNGVIERTGVASYRNYANWYIALTYLKKKDKNQSIKLLKKLPENSDFYNQAQDLIKELK